ncbi:hypothetical protein Pint_15321 [Pistacia integerrima]|uniref:Uncharacterized protein n=1 Tax=Pistacia integerrima TaxID=434235 RepID=A0ACC0ZFK3_9ROSI|nr:hypothetical protein Pint_15321 [Pistacia integerrima]
MGPLIGFMYRLLHIEIIRLLKKKRLDPCDCFPGINEVDIYKLDPSELPGLSETKSDEQVWNFFCEPYYKYANSKRANRKTRTGYWKITGKGCVVKDKSDKIIGSKETLVFYKHGCASKEAKTDWVMHEFYVKDNPLYKRDFAFCYIEKNPKSKSIISTPDDGESYHNLASDSENTESLSTEVELQLLKQHSSVSDPGNQVAANTSPMEDAPQIKELLEEFNALLAPELPINPEQGSNSSSYSNGFSSGQTLPADTGTHDIDTFVNEMFVDYPPAACVNHN